MEDNSRGFLAKKKTKQNWQYIEKKTGRMLRNREIVLHVFWKNRDGKTNWNLFHLLICIKMGMLMLICIKMGMSEGFDVATSILFGST